MDNKPVIGVAWFNKNDWEEWKKISEDKIEDDYDDWLAQVIIYKSQLEDEGFIVKQVTITPANFKIWCKENNKKSDTASRSEYVTDLLIKAHT